MVDHELQKVVEHFAFFLGLRDFRYYIWADITGRWTHCALKVQNIETHLAGTFQASSNISLFETTADLTIISAFPKIRSLCLPLSDCKRFKAVSGDVVGSSYTLGLLKIISYRHKVVLLDFWSTYFSNSVVFCYAHTTLMRTVK